MPETTDILNALVLFANYVAVPALSYGSQLALGALGVTLIFGILRFAYFAHGDLMAFASASTRCRRRFWRCPSASWPRWR